MIRPALAALAMLPLILPAPAAAIEATGHDAITTPGQAVEVRAKFERSIWLFRPDLKRRAVTFEVLGRRLSGRTDRDGMAGARVTPTQVGVYPIRATLDGKSGPAATSRLFVLDPARPCAVVDIDMTISNLAEWLVPFAGGKARAFEQSPEVLRDLARTHTIIYLTARDDVHDGRTRAFLKRRGFPDGPVVFNDMGLTTKEERDQLNAGNHGLYKLGVLNALKARGVRPVLGIGNTPTDAFAYEGAGLRSYILTNAGFVPSNGVSVGFGTYADLRARLVFAGTLPAPTPGLVSSVP